MKNIINSCSLKQYREHIEAGILYLQDQDIPVNSYTFGFLVQELNRYIAELEHPRYLAYVHGGIMDGVLDIRIHVADRFNQNNWVDSIQFVYPKNAKITNPIPPKSTWEFDAKPTAPAKPTIVPVPRIEVFNSEVQTAVRATGYKRNMSNTVYRKQIRTKYTTYTEYVNFVSVLFDELLGCTDCLNKTIIAAFLGRFAYPEAFISAGNASRQHLKLKPEIELNADVKKRFQIDWNYFLNNWDDNAILVAQYKSQDARRTYKNKHRSIDLIEQYVGNGTYELTDFGKVIWEKVRDLIGLLPEESVDVDTTTDEEEVATEEEPVETTTPEVTEAPAEEPKETEVPETETPVVEEKEVKIRHMGFNKCNGCAYFDKHRQWCDKRQGYINTLEHDECFEEEKPKLEIAEQDEVERICYNCKRWHSGNNPGGLKAIACRCPIHGKKTLTDHTCNKFVAIVKKEG